MIDGRTGWRGDAGAAIGLALILGAAWTARDWAALSALRLPDTDDAMRLQQVRDWLGGQRFGDLAQHRLGSGTPMHWSRLPDLAPAAIIAGLTPALGRHAAEVAAVVAWPLLLFAAALLLVARIAEAVGGRRLSRTAAVIAAIAYPATTIFMPGRIDHHGFQVVLLLAATLAALRGAGMAVGLLAAASLVIGVELTPLFVVLAAAMVAEWAAVPRPVGRSGMDERLAGLGVGALGGLLLARLAFAGSGWDHPACDAFDAVSWRAAMALAAAPYLLAVLPPASARGRALAAVLACGGAAVAALAVSPGCASPYGGVDPELRRLWLSQVAEAQSILSAPPGVAFGYAGLAVAGIAAGAWRLARERGRGWAILVALQLAALAITAAQLRGAYTAAMLAAPALAAVVAQARGRGALPLAGAWAASAGMLYPAAAQAVAPAAAATGHGRGDCGSPALLERLAALPKGMVMAPVDAGASIIAGTPHRVVAAPYHRNGPGILASFGFHNGSPAEAARIARAWRVDYAVYCAGHPAAGPRLAGFADAGAIVAVR